MKLEDFDLDNILINKNNTNHTKSHKNILIYDIPYEILIDTKPFCIRFHWVSIRWTY